VPKHVEVLTIVMYFILLSVFVGGSTDCKNVHDMNNTIQKIVYSCLIVDKIRSLML
jgi:hypothetical protein